MYAKQVVVLSLAGLVGMAPTFMPSAQMEGGQSGSSGLVRAVREATWAFRDVSAAEAAGYGSAGSCVSGPEEGAMGIHYPNGALVEDPALKASEPEILVYEQRHGRLRLVGVEYIVVAEDWHATFDAPPVLLGQHFHYVASPNRYGLPAFYELHVWAWKENPNGMFADWNPAVSCEDYSDGTGTASASSHGSAHGSR